MLLFFSMSAFSLLWGSTWGYNFDIILLNFQGCFLFFDRESTSHGPKSFWESKTMKFPTSFHLHFMGKMEAANEAHGPKPRNMSWSSTTDVAFGTTYSCCAKTSEEERSWDTNLLNVFKGERGNGNVRKSTWHLTKKIMSLRPYSTQSPQQQ